MRRTVSSPLALVGLAVVAIAPGQSRAANLTTLVSFRALPNCAGGYGPAAVIADANANLFGTTAGGGAHNGGTVFEITGGGFVVPVAVPPSDIATTASGLPYSRVTNTFSGTVTIRNISSDPINGPFSILFKSLSAGVTLANAQGTFLGRRFSSYPVQRTLRLDSPRASAWSFRTLSSA